MNENNIDPLAPLHDIADFWGAVVKTLLESPAALLAQYLKAPPIVPPLEHLSQISNLNSPALEHLSSKSVTWTVPHLNTWVPNQSLEQSRTWTPEFQISHLNSPAGQFSTTWTPKFDYLNTLFLEHLRACFLNTPDLKKNRVLEHLFLEHLNT